MTGQRETLVTSPSRARPLHLLVLPGDSWLPLLAGLGTAAFFLLLTSTRAVVARLAGLITTRTAGRREVARVAANKDLAADCRLLPPLPGPGGAVG